MYDESWIKEKLKESLNFRIAFVHRSYLNESSDSLDSNERLEFLGDSVLSLIISSYLYRKRADDSEGGLTNLRSYIVKTKSLSKAAKNLNLGRYLKLSKGEEVSEGRNNTQMLANTYEALIGAIYLDEGLNKAYEFTQHTLLPFFEKEIEKGPPKDSKSLLQEITQNQIKQSPKYKILSTEGPDHAKKFTVGVFVRGNIMGQGSGFSKQIAEEEAAKSALEDFNEDSFA